MAAAVSAFAGRWVRPLPTGEEARLMVVATPPQHSFV